MVNSKHYLQNYQDINSPNYSTPNPKLWKNDIIKCFLKTLSLFYLSVGNLQTISRLEVYQDLPSRNQTKVTVPSPNLITKLSPLLILPSDCYAKRVIFHVTLSALFLFVNIHTIWPARGKKFEWNPIHRMRRVCFLLRI